MLLRIKNVDHDGFNGRDFPPTDSDIGLIVFVAKAETWHDGKDADWEPVIAEDGRVYQPALPVIRNEIGEINDYNAGWVTTMFTCITKDGRKLELVDDEVAPYEIL